MCNLVRMSNVVPDSSILSSSWRPPERRLSALLRDDEVRPKSDLFDEGGQLRIRRHCSASFAQQVAPPKLRIGALQGLQDGGRAGVVRACKTRHRAVESQEQLVEPVQIHV